VGTARDARARELLFFCACAPASAVAKKSPRGEKAAKVTGSLPLLKVATSSKEAGSRSFTAPEVKPTKRHAPVGS
jgi:hypothetical protein